MRHNQASAIAERYNYSALVNSVFGRRMLRMELPGKRKRGRPKRRFMDVVKEDMAEVEVTEEDTVDRPTGEGKSAVATPDGKKPKEEEEEVNSVFY